MCRSPIQGAASTALAAACPEAAAEARNDATAAAEAAPDMYADTKMKSIPCQTHVLHISISPCTDVITT
jgi:hypothetical protein